MQHDDISKYFCFSITFSPWIASILLERSVFSGKLFRCENNVLIPIEKKCDGSYDCRYQKPFNPTDLSDEKYCRKSQ